MSTNPYQTPEGQLTDDDLAYGEVKFFSPSSRINRLRYWAHSMLFTFAMIAVFILIAIIAAFVSQTLAVVLGVVTYIGMIVYSFILIIQRLHDLNKSGWMSLLAIVPLANIYLIVLLIFFKGTIGRNNYGLQPPPSKTWHWIMAFSFPVLMVLVGILAAIALPAYQDYVTRAQGLDSSYNSPDGYPAQEDYPQNDSMSDDTWSDEGAIEDDSVIEYKDVTDDEMAPGNHADENTAEDLPTE